MLSQSLAAVHVPGAATVRARRATGRTRFPDELAVAGSRHNMCGGVYRSETLVVNVVVSLQTHRGGEPGAGAARLHTQRSSPDFELCEAESGRVFLGVFAHRAFAFGPPLPSSTSWAAHVVGALMGLARPRLAGLSGDCQ